MGELTFQKQLFNTFREIEFGNFCAKMRPGAQNCRTPISCGKTCNLSSWFQSKLLHVCFNITNKDRSVQEISLNQVYNFKYFRMKSAFQTKPLPGELGTFTTVKTRFWPWLEPFSSESLWKNQGGPASPRSGTGVPR